MAASWGRFLFFALVGLVLFYVGPKVGATAGVITGYALTLLYIQSPLEVIMSWLPDFLRGLVSLRKMDSLALGGTDLTPSPTPRPTQATFARLELRGVTHSYRHEKDDRVFTLGPIDCTLVPGELVFIVGGNGSGKTTLGKVLTGLYPPETGRIFLNGAEVTEGARDDYRQTFSAVFSDFFLFDRFLGLPAAAEAGRINDYLERLQLSHKVRIEGERLSTTALSQGQRKRLALLTAYLEDRPVYLFDEWAADQDPSFKDVFYRVLLPELKARSKAVVVITHDDRYFDAADRIIRLESGKLRAAAVERQALTTAS